MTDLARRRSLELTRAAGAVLLVSIVVWWMALRAWAEAQVGYLDVDAVGVGPFAWTVLLLVAGLALLIGALPRASDVAANVVSTGVFLVVTGALTAVNVAYGAHDGISGAGWAPRRILTGPGAGLRRRDVPRTASTIALRPWAARDRDMAAGRDGGGPALVSFLYHPE